MRLSFVELSAQKSSARGKLRIKCVFAVLAILFSLCLNLLTVLSRPVSAMSTGDSEYLKILTAGLKSCYSNTFKSPLSLDDFLTNSQSNHGVKRFLKNDDTKVILPQGYVEDDVTSKKCTKLIEEILTERRKIDVDEQNTTEKAATFLENLGYTNTTPASASGECVYFNYSAKLKGEELGVITTNKLCHIGDEFVVLDSGSPYGGEIVEFELKRKSLFDKKKTKVNLDCDTTNSNISEGGCGGPYSLEDMSWEDIISTIRNELLTHNQRGMGINITFEAVLDDSFMQTEPYGTATATYELNDSQKINQGIAFLLDRSYPGDTLTESEQFTLYQNYLTEYYGVERICGAELTDEVRLAKTDYTLTHLYSAEDGKTVVECLVKPTQKSDKKVYSVENHELSSTKIDYKAVAEWLLNSSTAARPDSAINSGPESDKIDGSRDEGVEATCRDAARGAAFILCTIADLASDALGGVYSWMEKYMVVDANLVKTTANDRGFPSATYQAWEYFRNITNILFVIFLLIVIFSQLTGFGIDNYGIKKSLPRLIAAAIIVNLSFYICAICVDLSNIIGAGINSFFTEIPIRVDESHWSVKDVLGSVGGGIGLLTLGFGKLISMGGGIGAVVLSGGLGTVLGAGAIAALIAFLVAVVSALITILTMVLLLGIRQGITVVGISIAPLAMVCYILPNTKQLFDRWLKIMQSMLIVYPLCGLLIGAGNFASRVILAASTSAELDFLLVIVSCFIQIGPYFLLPTLIRGSFKMVGNLGGVIAGFGRKRIDRARASIESSGLAMRNAERIKTARQHALDMGKVRAAQHRTGASVTSFKEARSQFSTAFTANDERTVTDYKKKVLDDESWSDAKYVAAVQKQNEITAKADREKKREYTDLYIANPQIEQATIAQATIEQANAFNKQLNWDNKNYQQGKRNEGRIARTNDLNDTLVHASTSMVNAELRKAHAARRNSVQDTLLYNEDGYMQGKLNAGKVSRDRDLKTTGLYTQSQYVQNRIDQNTAAVDTETIKMHQDRFATMDKNKIAGELATALIANDQHRATAAAKSLIGMGAEVELLNTLDAQSGAVNTMLADGSKNPMLQSALASSGNPILKEFVKAHAANSAITFKDFVDGTGAAAGSNNLAKALEEMGANAMTGMNKDRLEFLAGHTDALKSIPIDSLSKMLANSMSAATDGKEIAQLATIAKSLNATQAQEVVKSMSTAQFASINDTLRQALAKDAAGTKIEEQVKNMFENHIADIQLPGNAQILARMSQDERTRYGIVGRPHSGSTTADEGSSFDA